MFLSRLHLNGCYLSPFHSCVSLPLGLHRLNLWMVAFRFFLCFYPVSLIKPTKLHLFLHICKKNSKKRLTFCIFILFRSIPSTFSSEISLWILKTNSYNNTNPSPNLSQYLSKYYSSSVSGNFMPANYNIRLFPEILFGTKIHKNAPFSCICQKKAVILRAKLQAMSKTCNASKNHRPFSDVKQRKRKALRKDILIKSIC